MRLLVTGAGGFIGRAVARASVKTDRFDHVRLTDRAPWPGQDADNVERVVGDLSDRVARRTMLDGVDTVIHLAAVPGAAAEADPEQSRHINVECSASLMEEVAHAGGARFVYASSIAVFGALPASVDDETQPEPASVYGAHKRMMELRAAEFHSRGGLKTISVRLPGVVARPPGGHGFKSAFMSEAFHAAAAKRSFVFPISAGATMWMMSASCAARNLVHAALDADLDGGGVTLPALRVTARDLAQALFADMALVSFRAEPALERAFGAYPPLRTPRADALGFIADASLARLVEQAAMDCAGEQIP